jgi:hypothetical protein
MSTDVGMGVGRVFVFGLMHPSNLAAGCCCSSVFSCVPRVYRRVHLAASSLNGLVNLTRVHSATLQLWCNGEFGSNRSAASQKKRRKYSAADVSDMPVDPNEPTYCLCHQVSYVSHFDSAPSTLALSPLCVPCAVCASRFVASRVCQGGVFCITGVFCLHVASCTVQGDSLNRKFARILGGLLGRRLVGQAHGADDFRQLLRPAIAG